MQLDKLTSEVFAFGIEVFGGPRADTWKNGARSKSPSSKPIWNTTASKRGGPTWRRDPTRSAYGGGDLKDHGTELSGLSWVRKVLPPLASDFLWKGVLALWSPFLGSGIILGPPP